jgi:integrase
MPSVYQRRRKDGTKAKNFTTDIWVNGQKFPRALRSRTRREAEKEALEEETKLRAEFARRYEPLTMDTLMAKYRNSVYVIQPGTAIEPEKLLPSYKSVKYHMRRLVEILGKDLPLAELSNKHVSDYVQARRRMFVTSRAKDPRKRKPPKLVAPSTINRELDVLQAAYLKARDSWEHPVRPINWGDHRLGKTQRGDHTLSPIEARKAVLLARTKSRDVADAIELSFYTGIRQNELATIIPARIDLAGRTVVVLAKRKAKQEYRERTVYLNRAAVALLAERLTPGMDPQALVFRLTNGRKIWEWVRAQIGRSDVTWHDLRHTHASLLARATKDPLVVQRQLGHTHVDTSMGYIHTEDAQVIEGVEQIPRLTDDRKVVVINDAENAAEPPSPTTITDPASEKDAS